MENQQITNETDAMVTFSFQTSYAMIVRGSSEGPGDVFHTLRPRQNGSHFADDNIKRIFVNENIRISIKISLKFVPKGPINNNPALVQIMAWRRPGDKPLSEAMMVSLPTELRKDWSNYYFFNVPNNSRLFNQSFSQKTRHSTTDRARYGVPL